jgi:hypothetical protein
MRQITNHVRAAAFVSGWFRGAPLEDIGHDDVRELAAYALCYATP